MPQVTILHPADSPRDHQRQVATALSKLKSQMKKADILGELSRRETYEKPSRARRSKMARAARNRRTDESKDRRRLNAFRDTLNTGE
jgi:ribosomal protein S21